MAGATLDDLFAEVEGPAAKTSAPGGASYDDLFAEVEGPKTSGLGSAARGAAQELTFGFADEIAGGLESLFSKKTYKQARDESRQNYAKAEADNPGAYTAGQVAGGLASLALPVGAIGKAATTGAKVARAAAAGGIYGAGKSEAEGIGGLAADTATGAAFGAGLYGAGRLAGAGVKKVAGKVREVEAKLGPVADTIKQVVSNRALSALGGAIAGSIGGGGITSSIIGAGIGALAPKVASAVRKLLARGEVAAARVVAKGGPEWEKTAAAALAKAELHPPLSPARSAPTASMFEPPQVPTAAPSVAPPTASSVAPSPAPTPRPAPPVLPRDGKGRFLPADTKPTSAKIKTPVPAPVETEQAPAELVQRDVKPANGQGAFRDKTQAGYEKAFKGHRGRPQVVPDAEPQSGVPDAGGDTMGRLKAQIQKNQATVSVPPEDRGPIDALRNIVSSSSREGNIPNLKHYPVAPDVAFKEYLADLPRSTGSTAKGRREALSKLIIGVRNGEDPGEHIYRARAAGVPDEAIIRAVGVKSSKPIVPPKKRGGGGQPGGELALPESAPVAP